jgi:phenylacetate-CoA ligase
MNPTLIRKVVYPAYRALKRDRVLGYLEEMHRVESWDPDEIRRYQWNKMKRLLDYAAEHVPYYRDVFRTLGANPEDFKCIDDLAGFPVLRKEDIRENSEALISGIYPRKHLQPDSTGGSTGENLYFYIDRTSSEARRGNNIRMNEWIDIQIGDRTALLWGTAFDMERSRKLLNALRNWFSNTLLLSAYRMDAAAVRSYVARLRRFKPDLMVGYPSALAHFCQSMSEGGSDDIRPKAVLVSGETLYEWQREVIERTFDARVYNHYGCREFGALARECKMRDGLHIASERALFEMVPVVESAEGEALSELLVTDLDNFGMPFIRYAIGDMGTITWDRCACGLGLPRLETAIGRTFDVVRAPNGNFLGGTFWTILLRKKKGIERFQVIQDKLDEITIAIIPTDDFSDEIRQYVLDEVHEACGSDMRVRFELKPEIELTPSAKHRFVISRIGLTDEDQGRSP